MTAPTTDFSNVEPPPAPITDPAKDADAAYQWHVDHRRADAPPSYPVRGFGPKGEYTLWLPNTELRQQMLVVDGAPTMDLVPSAMSTPAMLELRMTTLGALKTDGKLKFNIALVKYAIELIRLCYTVTDDDLTMLLAGDRWHEEVVRHLLGGDTQAEVLLRHRAAEAVRERAAVPKVVYIPTPAPAVKRGWFARLFKH